MLKKLVFVIAICMLFVVSCNKKDDFYNANKKMSEMKSYSAMAEITINGNKGTSNHKVKQFFIDPNTLRVETLEPDFLKGKILCYSGQKWKVYHPLIKQTFEYDNLKEDDELIYLGVLQKKILISEDSTYELTTKDGTDYIQVRSSLPNSGEYRTYAVIYLSKDKYLPELMEIYSDKDKLMVQVKYTEFKYNDEINKELFDL
jgi:outer membrane lipoprotein-sorting protein